MAIVEIETPDQCMFSIKEAALIWVVKCEKKRSRFNLSVYCTVIVEMYIFIKVRYDNHINLSISFPDQDLMAEALENPYQGMFSIKESALQYE